MHEHHTTQELTGAEPGPRRREAEPRHGPAVLVVNARMLDDGLGHVGGWLKLDQPVPAVAEQLARIIGTNGRAEDYVVIDQTGLGDTAWPEHDLPGLLAAAEANQ